uniref:cDNA FLJ57790, moderately similar to Homo sapiens tetratricopeptide repeat domain 21A (TTC21A), mRNA n=1 Tax=Homo sapiens TaxID=9606 RepID=B4DSJ5_HUMAN|nr:unnamed protein product [Homo sapiens]
MIPSQKQLAASICIQFAEHYLAEKEYDKAVQSYKDVFSYLPTDNKVMLELAQLYLLQGHLDLCEQHCAILLQTEQNHETASVVGSPQHPLPPLPSSLPRVPVTRCRLLPSPVTSDASLTHL